MKKAMIILVSVLMIGFMSCTDKDAVTLKQTWVFNVTTVVSMSPTMEGYPMTSVMTIEKGNLTLTEAEAAVKDLSTTVSVTSGAYTMTTTTTATKAVKK